MPKLKENKEFGQTSSSVDNHASAVEDGSNDEYDYVIFVSEGYLDNSWINNLGCSYQSPNRDWFVDYNSIDEVFVFLENNKSYKVVGVGTIRIKIYNGVIRTLTNVRHVPYLKKKSIVSLAFSTHKVISILLEVEF